MAKFCVKLFIWCFAAFFRVANCAEQELSDEKNDGALLNLLDTSTGNIIPLKADLSDKIENLKLMIQEKMGISVEQQRLSFEGMELLDGWRLSDYNIGKDSTLHVRVNRDVKVKACVAVTSTIEICLGADTDPYAWSKRAFRWDTIYIIVKPSELIKTVKTMLEDKQPELTSFTYKLYRLRGYLTLLEDEYPLSHYDIKNNEKLLIIPDAHAASYSFATGPIPIPVNSTLYQYHTHM